MVLSVIDLIVIVKLCGAQNRRGLVCLRHGV